MASVYIRAPSAEEADVRMLMHNRARAVWADRSLWPCLLFDGAAPRDEQLLVLGLLVTIVTERVRPATFTTRHWSLHG
jgi:hypothetical protein